MIGVEAGPGRITGSLCSGPLDIYGGVKKSSGGGARWLAGIRWEF